MDKKKTSEDILSRKEMSDLLCQHLAIRSQMRFLIKGLNDISIKENVEIAPSTTLTEQITLYRYLLDDFQEAMRRHNELYEHIEMLSGGFSNEEIMIEKKEIERQLDNIVWITHYVVYHGIQRDELNRYVSDIIEGVSKICESIDVHITKTERVLK